MEVDKKDILEKGFIDLKIDEKLSGLFLNLNKTSRR